MSSGGPRPLEIAERYLAAATIAHEYIYDLHRELAKLDATNEHSRALLQESAALTLERMPELIRDLRPLEREWAEQELLDPPTAKDTAERIETGLAQIVPALAGLRARQDEIATEMLDLVNQAR